MRSSRVVPLKVSLIGRVGFEADGAGIDETHFPGRQSRLLFAYLVAAHGRPVPRDELADALWGELPPPTWEKALTVVVSRLRGLLAAHGVGGSTVLTGAFGCYRLELPEGSWVDVVAASESAHEAEQALLAGDLEGAKRAAGLAESLVRDPFLPGEDGTWVEEKRRELSDVRGRALAALAEAFLRTGDAQEAAKWADQAIALAPLRESGYRRLMDANVAAGNRAEALAVYERCRRLLAEELGAFPSPETESVYRALLATPAPSTRAAPTATALPRAEGGRSRKRVGATALTVGAAAVAVVVALASGDPDAVASAVPADAVGLLGADGEVRGQILLDAAPASVAYGHGAVWVTSPSANSVSRIDPRTSTVRQTIPVGAGPSAIAVGGRGVWVANHDDGTVSWINPVSNTVVRNVRTGNGPTAIAYGSGSVWVANAHDRTLSRIDADTGALVATIPIRALGRGIAVGGGSVWVTDEATRNVIRIDSTTNRMTNAEAVGSGPAGIVYGDGALWVADRLAGTVSEVDPRTLAVRAAVPVSGSPSALAFGDGAIWVSAEYAEQVVRIDTRTHARSAIRIANRPKGLAAVPGGVWVAVQSSGTGHRGGRLVVHGGGLDSIDPARNSLSFGALNVAYDALTGFRRVGGSEGTQLVPNLATALPLPTEGGRSYTFAIRPGIRYSDGSRLAASDFARALERILAIGDATWLQGSALRKVVGAAGCSQARCDLSRGVIVDGNSVTFRLTAPDASFPLHLTWLVPVPAGTPPGDTGTTPIPSTGPYAIESYLPGKQLTFVRNGRFRSWSQAARPNGYPDEIVWRIGVPRDEAVHQVRTGRADVLFAGVPPDRVEELAARHPGRLHLVPQHATAFVFLNTRRKPFDDVRVRRAVNYAMDRREVAALHGGAGVAQPTCQVLPPVVPGYRRYCPYTVDPGADGEWKAPDLATARRLIAASGTSGERIVVWTFPFFGKEARYFVALLRRLGYRAELQEVGDVAEYFAGLDRTPSAQAGFAGWFGMESAAHKFEVLGCGYARNWARFCDPRIDAQVRQLARRQERDPTAGAGLAARIDRELVDQAPWVPLFTPRFADFVSQRVGNYQANTYASSTVLLDQLWVR